MKNILGAQEEPHTKNLGLAPRFKTIALRGLLDFPPRHLAQEATLWAPRRRFPTAEGLPVSAPRAHRMDGVRTVGTLSNPRQFLRNPVYDGKEIQLGITFADLEQPTGYLHWLTANVQDEGGGLLVEEHGVPGAFS